MARVEDEKGRWSNMRRHRYVILPKYSSVLHCAANHKLWRQFCFCLVAPRPQYWFTSCLCVDRYPAEDPPRGNESIKGYSEHAPSDERFWLTLISCQYTRTRFPICVPLPRPASISCQGKQGHAWLLRNTSFSGGSIRRNRHLPSYKTHRAPDGR